MLHYKYLIADKNLLCFINKVITIHFSKNYFTVFIDSLSFLIFQVFVIWCSLILRVLLLLFSELSSLLLKVFPMDIIVTGLLLLVVVGLEGWGVVHLCQGLGWGTGGWIIFFYIFCSAFVVLLIVLSWLVHKSFLCLFHCSFFAFFVSGHFN